MADAGELGRSTTSSPSSCSALTCVKKGDPPASNEVASFPVRLGDRDIEDRRAGKGMPDGVSGRVQSDVGQFAGVGKSSASAMESISD